MEDKKKHKDTDRVMLGLTENTEISTTASTSDTVSAGGNANNSDSKGATTVSTNKTTGWLTFSQDEDNYAGKSFNKWDELDEPKPAERKKGANTFVDMARNIMADWSEDLADIIVPPFKSIKKPHHKGRGEIFTPRRDNFRGMDAGGDEPVGRGSRVGSERNSSASVLGMESGSSTATGTGNDDGQKKDGSENVKDDSDKDKDGSEKDDAGSSKDGSEKEGDDNEADEEVEDKDGDIEEDNGKVSEGEKKSSGNSGSAADDSDRSSKPSSKQEDSLQKSQVAGPEASNVVEAQPPKDKNDKRVKNKCKCPVENHFNEKDADALEHSDTMKKKKASICACPTDSNKRQIDNSFCEEKSATDKCIDNKMEKEQRTNGHQNCDNFRPVNLSRLSSNISLQKLSYDPGKTVNKSDEPCDPGPTVPQKGNDKYVEMAMDIMVDWGEDLENIIVPPFKSIKKRRLLEYDGKQGDTFRPRRDTVGGIGASGNDTDGRTNTKDDCSKVGSERNSSASVLGSGSSTTGTGSEEIGSEKKKDGNGSEEDGSEIDKGGKNEEDESGMKKDDSEKNEDGSGKSKCSSENDKDGNGKDNEKGSDDSESASARDNGGETANDSDGESKRESNKQNEGCEPNQAKDKKDEKNKKNKCKCPVKDQVTEMDEVEDSNKKEKQKAPICTCPTGSNTMRKVDDNGETKECFSSNEEKPTYQKSVNRKIKRTFKNRNKPQNKDRYRPLNQGCPSSNISYIANHRLPTDCGQEYHSNEEERNDSSNEYSEGLDEWCNCGMITAMDVIDPSKLYAHAVYGAVRYPFSETVQTMALSKENNKNKEMAYIHWLKDMHKKSRDVIERVDQKKVKHEQYFPLDGKDGFGIQWSLHPNPYQKSAPNGVKERKTENNSNKNEMAPSRKRQTNNQYMQECPEVYPTRKDQQEKQFPEPIITNHYKNNTHEAQSKSEAKDDVEQLFILENKRQESEERIQFRDCIVNQEKIINLSKQIVEETEECPKPTPLHQYLEKATRRMKDRYKYSVPSNAGFVYRNFKEMWQRTAIDTTNNNVAKKIMSRKLNQNLTGLPEQEVIIPQPQILIPHDDPEGNVHSKFFDCTDCMRHQETPERCDNTDILQLPEAIYSWDFNENSKEQTEGIYVEEEDDWIPELTNSLHVEDNSSLKPPVILSKFKGKLWTRKFHDSFPGDVIIQTTTETRSKEIQESQNLEAVSAKTINEQVIVIGMETEENETSKSFVVSELLSSEQNNQEHEHVSSVSVSTANGCTMEVSSASNIMAEHKKELLIIGREFDTMLKNMNKMYERIMVDSDANLRTSFMGNKNENAEVNDNKNNKMINDENKQKTNIGERDILTGDLNFNAWINKLKVKYKLDQYKMSEFEIPVKDDDGKAEEMEMQAFRNFLGEFEKDYKRLQRARPIPKPEQLRMCCGKDKDECLYWCKKLRCSGCAGCGGQFAPPPPPPPPPRRSDKAKSAKDRVCGSGTTGDTSTTCGACGTEADVEEMDDGEEGEGCGCDEDDEEEEEEEEAEGCACDDNEENEDNDNEENENFNKKE